MFFNLIIGARVAPRNPPWLMPKGVAKVGLCSAIYSCSNGEVEKHICGFKCMTIRPLHLDINSEFFYVNRVLRLTRQNLKLKNTIGLQQHDAKLKEFLWRQKFL